MADITVQLADGRTLSFPEGTMPDVIDRVAKQETASQHEPSGFMDQVGQGMQFGFGDEIAAAGGAIGQSAADLVKGRDVDFGRAYDKLLAEERGGLEAYKQQNPNLALVGEVLGGVAGGIGTAPKGLARAIGASAAEGGLYGVGTSEGGVENRLKGGLQGAATGAIASGAMRGAQKGIGSIADYAKDTALMKASPTIQKLKSSASRLYDKLGSSDVRFKDDEFVGFADGITKKMRMEGSAPKLTDKVEGVLGEINKMRGVSPSFSEMDILRKQARIAAGSLDKAEARLGSIIIDEIDTFVEKGSASLGAKAKTARQLWGKVRRDEDVSAAIKKANNNPSGIDQGLKVEFRKILNSPKKLRGFTKPQIAQMEKMVRGTAGSNIMKNVGRMGFGLDKNTPHIVGGSLGVGSGMLLGGPVGAVAVQGAGMGARYASEALQKRNANVLGAMVRSGSPKGIIDGVAKKLESIGNNNKAFQDLTRGLMAAGVNIVDQEQMGLDKGLFGRGNK